MENDATQGKIPYNRLIRACGMLAGAAGAAALLGWIFAIPFLSSLGSGKIPMAPSTAVLFLLYGLVLTFRPKIPLRKGLYWASLSASLLGCLVGLLLLSLSAQRIYLGIETLGFKTEEMVAGVPIGHMSPLTALGFVLAGMGLLLSLSLSPVPRVWRSFTTMLLSSVVVTLFFVLLLAYLYGDPLLYSGQFIPPAATTSLAFVALGIGLLALAISQLRISGRSSETSKQASYRFILVFVLLSIGIVVTGALYQRSYERHYRTETERLLSGVAELKVNEIVQWRKERLGDAEVFHKNKDFSGLVKRYFGVPEDPDARERIRTWLSQVQAAYHYDRISLLDAQCTERISAPDAPEAVFPRIRENFSKTLHVGKADFLDFYRDAPDRPVYLSILVPIPDEQDAHKPLGVLVFRIDPKTYLYPLINSWPTPSETAETLIVRREGNEVVFLNELRFKKDAALSLRRSLDDTLLPAAQAALGVQGTMEGTDYRGIPVVAYVCSIPDSPWGLVARMDMSEIYGPLREKLWQVVALAAALLLGAGACVGLIWRQQRLHFYRERYLAAEALRESEERHRMTLMSVGDAVIATDATGRVQVLNPVAEYLTGWSNAEALGHPLDEVFHIVNESTRKRVENPVQKVLSEGSIVGLANHTLLISRDGVEHPIADSAAPIQGADGATTGVVLVFRDQTGEHAARKALQDSEARYRTLVQNIPQKIFMKDRESRYVSVSENLAQDLGVSPEEAAGKTDLDFFPEELASKYRADDRHVMGTGETEEFEERYLQQGKETWILTVKTPVRDANNEIVGILGIFRDITEHRRAEEALRASEARYRRLFEAAKDGILVLDAETGVVLDANPFLIELLNIRYDALAGKKFWELGLFEGIASDQGCFQELLHHGYVRYEDVPIQITQDREIDVEFVSNVYVASNRKVIQCTIRDITAQKQGQRRIEHLNRVLRAIRDVNKLIIHEKEPKKLVQEACNLLVEERGYSAALTILTDANGVPHTYVEAGLGTLFAPLSENLSRGILPPCCYEAQRHDGVYFVTDPHTVCKTCPIVEDCEQNNCMCAPLVHNNASFGYLLVSTEHPLGADDEEENLFEEMTGDIAFALNGIEMERKREIMERERQEMEMALRQQQKTESIGLLAGGVAHEINNPITGVLNYAQLILERLDEREEIVREFAREIIHESKRIAAIVSNLLTYARQEKQSHSPARPIDILDAVFGLIRTVIRHDQIAIEVDVPEELPRLLCRSQQIQQVLLNLMTNARDALNERYPGYDPNKIMRISAGVLVDDNASWLRITVEDHGKGIPAEVHEQMFDPFFTTKPRGIGTGLGLSISHGIVTEHGGRITIESEPNMYTRFHVDLPVAPTDSGDDVVE